MSYDTYVHCHTCGENLLRQTSASAGCAALWEATGAILKDWDGKTAHEVLPMLVGAIQSLPGYYQGDNPDLYKDTVRYLEALRDACCRDPFAVVNVSH